MKTGEAQLTISSAYLAGPMRGYADHNFPAFHGAATWLRSKGWRIFSPAERDEADPDIPNVALSDPTHVWEGKHDLAYFMQYDLAAVCSHQAVICLPGWENSQGARLETMVAVEVGHPVFEITEEGGTALRTDRKGNLKFDQAQLSAVSPDYVRAVFTTETLGFLPVSDIVIGDEGVDPDVIQVDPEYNPTAVMGPKDEVPREATPAERKALGIGVLPSASLDRKGIPITTGVLDYFPAALVEVAKVSKAGNDKHNPGQPLHHARGKSTDHADSLLRHMIDRGKVDEDTGCRHSAEVAWRALAMLQQELEDEGAPLARGARLG